MPSNDAPIYGKEEESLWPVSSTDMLLCPCLAMCSATRDLHVVQKPFHVHCWQKQKKNKTWISVWMMAHSTVLPAAELEVRCSYSVHP